MNLGNRRLLLCLLCLVLVVEVGAEEEAYQEFDDLAILSETELKGARGGFMVNGLDLDIAVRVDVLVDHSQVTTNIEPLHSTEAINWLSTELEEVKLNVFSNSQGILTLIDNTTSNRQIETSSTIDVFIQNFDELNHMLQNRMNIQNIERQFIFNY